MPSPKAINDLAGEAQRAVQRLGDTGAWPDLARQAQKSVAQGVEHMRGQVGDLDLNDRLDEARDYVVEHVKERPVRATVAALVVGFLFGLLFAGNRK